MNPHANTSRQFADLPATVCSPTSPSSYHPTVNGKVPMQEANSPSNSASLYDGRDEDENQIAEHGPPPQVEISLETHLAQYI